MINVMKLRGKIVEKGFTQKLFSKEIGMHISTLNRKLKTGEDFSIRETNKIVDALELTKEEAFEIFFNHEVA